MNLQTTPRFSDPEQETIITDLERALIGYAELQGRQNAQQNKPITDSEFKALLVNNVETTVQAAIDRNQERHLPVSGMVTAQTIKDESKEKIIALQKSITGDEHAIHALQERKRRLMPDSRKKWIQRIVYLGIAIISAAEGAFAYDALRNTSFPKITAAVTALGIAVVIAFAAHIGGGYIRRATTTIQRMFRYCIILIPAWIAFYALGTLRASSYNTAALYSLHIQPVSEPTHIIQVWAITIISFAFFVVALVLAVKFYKSTQQRKAEQEYDRVCKEHTVIEQRIVSANNEIATIEQSTNQKVAEALARYELAVATENRLQSIGKRALESYANQNLRYRTDNQYPAFFANLPVLQYNLFFDHRKKN